MRPRGQDQYLLDSLTIKALLKEKGPLSWHDLQMAAFLRDINICGRPSEFDKALCAALDVGFIKARFEVCTPAEETALNEHSVHPGIAATEPGETVYPPPTELCNKLLQQRSDQIRAGVGLEGEGAMTQVRWEEQAHGAVNVKLERYQDGDGRPHQRLVVEFPDAENSIYIKSQKERP